MTDAEFSTVVLHEDVRGWSADAGGYVCEPGNGVSIASFWRNSFDRRVWTVSGYTPELSDWDGARAVMDDHGNLRRVPA